MIVAFSEAWLHQHQTKMASYAAPPKAGPIVIVLREPFLLLNVLLRMHWRARSRYAASVSAEIAAASAPREAAPPLERARVRIERHSTGIADQDGLYGGAKLVVDCLLAKSKRHPHGLGFIVDDAPDRLTLEVVGVKATARDAQRTVITIEPAP